MTMEGLDVYEVVIDTKPEQPPAASLIFSLSHNPSQRITIMVAATGYGQAVKKARQYIELINLKAEVLKEEVSSTYQSKPVLDVVSIGLTPYKFIQ